MAQGKENMSVPKSKRGESGYEVVNTAGDLYNKTIQICLKLPKRYTYLVLQPIVELAGKVADYTKSGNSVYPSNAHEVQIRRDYFIHARATLQSLISRANIIIDIPTVLTYKDGDKTKGVTKNELQEWADLMGKEDRLIAGAMKKDKERYKDLK